MSAGSASCTNVPPLRDHASDNLLHQATDWVLLSDSVTSQLVFPSSIAIATLRPDVVLYSRSRKVEFWLELTVCLEDRFSVGNQRKQQRYAELARQCELSGCLVGECIHMLLKLVYVASFLRPTVLVHVLKCWDSNGTRSRRSQEPAAVLRSGAVIYCGSSVIT